MLTPFDCRTYINHILPTLEGWCTQEKATDLVVDIINRKPKECVEVGVFAGRSLFAVAFALKYNGEGSVLGIDPWEPDTSVEGFDRDDPNHEWWAKVNHDKIYDACIEKINELELNDQIRIFRGTSEDAAKRYAEEGKMADMIHIDGNHSEECSVKDVEMWMPLLKKSGVFWFDDIDWSTTYQAQKLIEKSCDIVMLKKQYAMYQKR